METTIDGAGRVVIPKVLRERLGLTAGRTVEISETEGAVLVRPKGPSTKLVRRRGRPVLEPTEPTEPLTADIVRDLVERSRR